MKTKLKLINNKIAIIPDKPKTETESGIQLPNLNEQFVSKGKVLASDYKKILEGNYIVYEPHMGTRIELNEETVLIIKPQDVICIIEE